jgi:hypothetical protein
MKIVLIALVVMTAMVGLFVYGLDNQPRVTNATDRNVPGTTTGQGRNSLTSQQQ